jgi:hypothetical protein
VPQVWRLVAAFGLVHKMNCRYREAALALNPKPAFGFRSAANPEMLPNPEPRALREHFVMPSIRSRNVAWAEWPYIRRLEHSL